MCGFKMRARGVVSIIPMWSSPHVWPIGGHHLPYVMPSPTWLNLRSHGLMKSTCPTTRLLGSPRLPAYVASSRGTLSTCVASPDPNTARVFHQQRVHNGYLTTWDIFEGGMSAPVNTTAFFGQVLGIWGPEVSGDCSWHSLGIL